jgi:hypothetical protein
MNFIHAMHNLFFEELGKAMIRTGDPTCGFYLEQVGQGHNVKFFDHQMTTRDFFSDDFEFETTVVASKVSDDFQDTLENRKIYVSIATKTLDGVKNIVQSVRIVGVARADDSIVHTCDAILAGLDAMSLKTTTAT